MIISVILLSHLSENSGRVNASRTRSGWLITTVGTLPSLTMHTSPYLREMRVSANCGSFLRLSMEPTMGRPLGPGGALQRAVLARGLLRHGVLPFARHSAA